MSINDRFRRIVPYGELSARISGFQDRLKSRSLDGALLIQKADLFYYTGTTQTGWLYVPCDGDVVFMVFRNVQRAEVETPLPRVIPVLSPKKIPDILKGAGLGQPKNLGMELDEFPFVARGQTQVLTPGMTLALEPKVILQGKGVVGIENTWVVIDTGLERLTRFPDAICIL